MNIQQLSTKGQASNHGYENTPGHGSTGPGDVELAHVDVNVYDTLQQGSRDEHAYDVAGKVLTSSEVTLSRRSAIILVVSGVILSAVISIITGVVVYQLTSDTITQTGPEVNTSHQLDALEQIQVDLSKLQTIVEQTQANTTRELDNTRGELNALQTTLTAGQNAANLQLDMLQAQLNSSGQQVAFSVYGFNSDLLPDRTPTFLYTAINTGHYNMTSGRFTCPVAGLYYFSLSLEHDSTSNGNAHCYFSVNGSIDVYVRAQNRPHEVASGSVIRHLSVNDVMSLFCYGWQYVRTGLHNTVFSGFLISPD